MIRALGLAATLTLAAGPLAAAPWVITPSGSPEAIFIGLTPADVEVRLAAGCGAEDLEVVSRSAAEVVCGDPKISIMRLAIMPMGPDVRVIGRVEIIEAAPKNEVAWRTERGGDRVQRMLLTLGGAVPPGSRGGRPYLGVEGEDAGEGRWLVQKVTPGTPAEAQGLMPGDIVTQIDGKPFRNFADFARKLREKALGETFSLTVLRADQTLNLPMTATSMLGEQAP